MGDHYQIIADLDVSQELAEDSINQLRQWMISQKIISAVTSDCVLGSSSGGHAPAENYIMAVQESDPSHLKLRTNGVAFISKRTVFFTMGSELVCSNCAGRFEGGDLWTDAIGEWFENSGDGIFACELCGAKFPITEWQHDPPWAFGNAGVEFWNWSPLRPDFIKQVGDILKHRVRLVWGKI
jgi:hypothetical protein